MRRVLTPQEVVKACSSLPSPTRELDILRLREILPEENGRFPAWIAFRSWTIASTVSVCSAPGKPFPFGLLPGDHRNGQMIPQKRSS